MFRIRSNFQIKKILKILKNTGSKIPYVFPVISQKSTCASQNYSVIVAKKFCHSKITMSTVYVQFLKDIN